MKYLLNQLDPTTGFLDRNGCLNMANDLMTRARTTGQSLAMFWLDIDRFKQINESFGYLGGDNFIALVANRLKCKLSNRAEIGRVGADEFVCMVPNLDLVRSEQMATELMRIIEPELELSGIRIRPTVSIGIAILEPDDDTFGFLERADRAKTAAKKQGGNRYVISGSEPLPGRLGIMLVREELEIENKLHTALENGGLQLHYQPIIALDGKVQAVEALMRCRVNGENITPTKFIPVAEKTGLIVRLGEWSLLQGARHARCMSDAGIITKTAINVSRLQLVDPKFSQVLNAALICADVSPKLLELELTESLFMDISDTVQSNLRVARKLGIGLAIDDFGTGYSCLANLKDLPATKLKLDRAFVCVLPHDRRAFSVVKAMAQLGKELGMIIVAEGAETTEQVEALTEAGVDCIQGYIYAKPMDDISLFSWFKERAAL
ncbi:MAG: EAL domain-containing protein [Methylovulum sp.]|nr:EAL domain-containing protein [Methylovulum sp.]